MRKLLLFVPFLCACATWQGKPESQLIAHYGVPTQKMGTSDGEIYQYMTCDSNSLIVPVGNVLIDSGESCNKKMFLIKDHFVVKDMGTIYH